MLKPKIKRGPFKHSQEVEHYQMNLIYRGLKLEEVFKDHDICEKHSDLYEFERMSTQEPTGIYRSYLNGLYSDIYTNNLFYDPRVNKKIEVENSFKKKYSEVLKDSAHVSLYYSIWKNLTSKSSDLIENSSIPENRFFLIQGGIGSGKSTMLRFFEKKIFQNALNIDFPEYQAFMLFVDFQVGFSDHIPIQKKEIFSRLKTSLIEKYPFLGTKEARFEISSQVIKQKKIDIEIALDPREKELSIVRETEDEEVFVSRSLNYLSDNNFIIVIVFDNADLHTSENEMQIFGYLNGILWKVPKALGIITLREYTLNDLGQLQGMRAYYDLKTMHITTPSLTNLLKKRFDLATKILDDHKPPTLQLENYKITMTSYKEFLDKWRLCILSHDREDVISWLLFLTNANVRDMMRILRAVMGSAKINVPRIISDFYNNIFPVDITKYGKPWTQYISSDEFLRLLMLGNINEFTSSIYKDTPESLVNNIFDYNNEMPAGPTSLSGKFPILIKSRIMYYFGSAQSRTKMSFLERFSIYGYEKDELLRILQWFINNYFLESKEGSRVEVIEELTATRKLGFYYHKFSKFIIVLENMRNDVFLTYQNDPHLYETTLPNDIDELLNFFLEIMEYECQEYAFMKRNGTVNEYATLVGNVPITWRLLKSCHHRLLTLKLNFKNYLDQNIVKEIVDKFNKTREIIIKKNNEDILFPRMSLESRNRCKRLSYSDFI